MRSVQVYDGDGRLPDADPYVHERYDEAVRSTRRKARWLIDTLLKQNRELSLVAAMTLQWLAGNTRVPPPGLDAQALANALEAPLADLGVAVYCAGKEGDKPRVRKLRMVCRKLKELAKLLRGG